jgi:hypothetical protein
VDTPDLTAVTERLGRGTEQLTAEARELRQRVGSSLEELQATQHVREVGDQLRHQLDDTIKPAVHQAAPSLGKGLLSAITGLASLPLFLLRFVARLLSTAESVPERGAELKERAQHLLQDNPRARRQRRQRRVQLAAWTGAGFGVGVGLGWFLGRRSATELMYDAPLPVPPPATASTPAASNLAGSNLAANSPATSTPADIPTTISGPAAAASPDRSTSDETVPQDPFEAAAAAEEALEDQLEAAADTEELIEAQLDEAVRDEAAGEGSDRPTPEA